ncbi:MAG TPA: ABC transporter ATP-binding protein [Alphaproteobacteria bacterium]|nr:ABC transporter ATP-binding protein [Alphaproteobacteria bacterium]
MSDAVLRVENLHVTLPPRADRSHAVEDVSFDLRRGELVCLVGESGSGKSVTARAVMGLLAPRVVASAGRILFNGEDLLRIPPERLRAIRGAEISMIFQEPMTALNPLMTIGRQIDEVLSTHTQLSAAARRERLLALLSDVHLPDPASLIEAYPHQLSGGQRQRAMIAMALVLEPKILIADEPTTALDVTTQAQILQLIRELQAAHGTAVLFITHDFGVVAEIAHRVAVMQNGKLVEMEEASRVLNQPRHPYTQRLIAAVPSLTPRLRTASQGPVALTATKVTKTFRTGGGLLSRERRVVHAVKDASIALRRGETLGLVGESGSGKSTLARCIIRLIEPDGGQVRLGELDLTAQTRRSLRRHRRRIQMVFQDPFGSLNPRYKVGHLVAEGPIINGVDAVAARARAIELLGLVGLDARAADRFPHEFSGGQRQRIAIARALALEPEILVADEPVSALDVSVQAQVLDLLAGIRHRLNLSMLFITHDLRVAAQVCDTIAVMRHGEIVETGPTAEVFARPQHTYTRELFASVPGRAWSQRACRR